MIPEKCSQCEQHEKICGADFCMKTAALIEQRVPESCPVKEAKDGHEDLQQLHSVQGEV